MPEGQSPEQARIAATGVAEVAFARRGGTTRLTHLHQRNPLRVLFPAAEAGDIDLAVLLTTSGGLVAGDRLAISAHLEDGAAAHVTAAAAEKVYRSTGATTIVTQHLTVGEGAWLEYLPPETILFDGARLRRDSGDDIRGDFISYDAKTERFTVKSTGEPSGTDREGRVRATIMPKKSAEPQIPPASGASRKE